MDDVVFGKGVETEEGRTDSEHRLSPYAERSIAYSKQQRKLGSQTLCPTQILPSRSKWASSTYKRGEEGVGSKERRVEVDLSLAVTGADS